MKKFIVVVGVAVSLAAASLVLGQTGQEGLITFEVKVNMHRNLPPERQEMKHMIPEFRTTKEQLAFNSNSSLYKPLEPEEDEELEDGEGMQVRIRVPQNEFYVNRATGARTLLQEFMGRKYLIEDSLKVAPWKFGEAVREILGYSCREASYTNQRNQKIVAWYTESLPAFLGPESFNTLPGTVLLVDINDGERVILATGISLRPPTREEIRMSGGGIKTTEEEFRVIREEQMKRMRANGANVIIRN